MDLVAELRALVGDNGVLTGERLAGRVYDKHVGSVAARVLVRPASTEQVSAVLRLCHSRGQPIVPHGGLTGLVYGCSARENEVILSLELLNRIESVDVAGRTLRVQAGVKLQHVQEEAERHNLMFPLDLGARGSATIGGNIATNAGGMRVVRYGMMRNLVLGLEVVLADGTVLQSLNRMLKNNAGYDLKQLFIGSEGTLGVVTRADLRLAARPVSACSAFVACRDFAAMVELLGMLDARLGGQLSAFEALWPEFYELTTTSPARSSPILPYGHGVYALIEALGADADTDRERFERVLSDAMENGLVADAVIAKSEADRNAMWAPREDVFQMDRYGTSHSFDVSLGIADMPRYLEAFHAALHAGFPGARSFVFGHVADGNLHIAVCAGDADVQSIEKCVYEPMRGFSGSISAEHGIGLERKPYLEISRSSAEIATMRALKAALDPRGILNPGKVIDVH
ncbi:MAG: FAD-binding oxidoreductase [Proteobacteria bacterium]|nr:FAD-binding oxidoreductase [Pseudomonadota bacterium]